MNRALPLITAVAGSFSGEPELANYTYSRFVEDYGKQPYAVRETIFNANMELIRQHNLNPVKTWVAGPNEFTDWTNDEFRAQRTSERPNGPLKPVVELPKVDGLPAQIDWREKRGVVTPVKNQGQCGSCWTFSATETLESHFAIATNEDAPILGPQQIVSCCEVPGAGGCNGGTQEYAFKYTSTVGLSSEASYPYTGKTGTCDKSKIKPDVINSGYVALKTNDYTQLVTAAATKGPVAISVAAGGLGWQFYRSGIFAGGLFGCGFAVDHAVQLVGYGEENDVMYWLVRNSWGTVWGESGYIRIKRFGEGKEPCGKGDGTTFCGECGILSDSSYPTNVRKAGAIVV